MIKDFAVIDIEADGLSPTQIYCMTVEKFRNRKSVSFETYTGYPDMVRALEEEEYIVGHNIILWDIPRIERILFEGVTDERKYKQMVRSGYEGFRLSNRLIDTLALSWYLRPDRLVHGLESYGEDFGIEKPKINDWFNQTLEEYIHRNREDVKINSRLFMEFLSELDEIYEGGDISGIVHYLMWKMDCAREQEEVGWKLDIEKAESNLRDFINEIDKKTGILADSMPPLIKYKELKVPAKMYNKDGQPSKRGQDWLDLLEELELPSDYKGTITLERSSEIGNPGSYQQIKNWLYELGWVPETFKYNKDKDTGKVTKIEQLSLPKSEGGGICPSIKKLYPKMPVLEELENLFVLRHRKSVINGFLRDVDEDGYLMAQVAGFTNTLRFKHSTIVNLPGVTGKHKPGEGKIDWKDGIHIRGVLSSPDGYVLAGSDMSSLEDRTKQHYMYFFDPEYVESMIKPGFDPHLDLAIFANAITGEDAEWYKEMTDKMSDKYIPSAEEKDRYNEIKKQRSDHKTVNYAATYGSGADTMSKNSGMDIKRAAVLIKAYKKKNWSLARIAKSAITKTVGKQMWLKNPISGFWYSLRYEKDIFSTLNQGTGVYCFDFWVSEVREQGIKVCGQFHDEIVVPTEEDKTQEMAVMLKDALRRTNDTLRLNRELGNEVQFGKDYSEIH